MGVTDTPTAWISQESRPLKKFRNDGSWPTSPVGGCQFISLSFNVKIADDSCVP